MLYEVGRRVMECRRIRQGVCSCVGNASRTALLWREYVVANNASILRFERISVRQDEILPSGRKTYSPT